MAIDCMTKRFEGSIISLKILDCHAKEVNAKIVSCPSVNNKYHCEIHGSDEEKELSDIQALILAKKSIVELNRS